MDQKLGPSLLLLITLISHGRAVIEQSSFYRGMRRKIAQSIHWMTRKVIRILLASIFCDRKLTFLMPDKLQPLIIECDDYVWSLAFGSSSNSSSDVSDKNSTELIMPPSSGKTNRFFNFRSEINQLILAVGLNNGRIRIYSVFSGMLCIFVQSSQLKE